MDMKLYGICFKLRGGPDLLSHVQANEPVPVEMMAQIMDQVGSLTKDELDFAQTVMENWKKAFGDRVPLNMTVNTDKGYDITCSVPDELVSAISLVTGKEPGELMKEYTADYMKNVLGIEADILSVDVEHDESVQTQPVPVQAQNVQGSGFSLSDLDESPETPAFEDVSSFADMDMGMDIPVEGFDMPAADDVPEETPMDASADEAVEDDIPGYMEEPEDIPDDIPEDIPDEDEAFYDDEADGDAGDDEDVIDEPDIPDEDEPDEDKAEDEKDPMADAISGIYKDMVQNIRDRELDTRLNLRIGQRPQ